MEPSNPSLQWFVFLELREPIRCLDVGAMAIGEGEDPWVALARNGCAEVIGFEPIEAACAQLNEKAMATKGAIRYLPYALADGEEHELHVTNVPTTSSLFEPARETVDLFPVELIETHEHGSRKSHELAKLAGAVLTVQGLGLKQASQRIRSRSYDVIVETSGFTRYAGLGILASRCAPVQCHYIGFHATTGLDTIDWFIGDEHIAGEDLADQFVERLRRLPRLWLASSFNQFAKVRGGILRFWAAALRRIPEAELHLKNHVTDSHRPRQRIVEELSRRGIDPLRVVFLPHRNQAGAPGQPPPPSMRC